MIEDTRDLSQPDKRFGRVDMTTKVGYDSLMKKLNDSVNVDEQFNLSKLDVDIYIVFCSENKPTATKGSQTLLKRTELEDLWRKIFERFGYSKNSEKIVISFRELPEKLKK